MSDFAYELEKEEEEKALTKKEKCCFCINLYTGFWIMGVLDFLLMVFMILMIYGVLFDDEEGKLPTK